MIEIRHDRIEEQEDLRLAYDNLYKNRAILHLDSLYRWLINLLHPRPGETLLDISCGEGRLVEIALQMNLRAMGIDLSIEGIRKSSIAQTGLGLVVGDGECLPLDSASFDYVTHIGSLEHYIHPEAGSDEIARILKPGGKACVLLPNMFGFWGNMLYVAKKGDVFDDGQPLQRYGTRKAWSDILEKSGLTVTEVHSYAGSGLVFPHNRRDLLWILAHPLKIVKFLADQVIPINWANHFVFICRHN